jgi:hypothetical protein
MHHKANKHTNTTGAYVPPSKRITSPSTAAAPPRTEKKELKKEFLASNPIMFPTLGETMLRTSSSSTCNISFSSAAAKQIVVPEVIKPDVAPGWVHIRKHLGIVQYKYGPKVSQVDYSIEEDKFLADTLYKYRLERQQYDQDGDVKRLGDLSYYYGKPTLAEIQEEFERRDTADREALNYAGSSDDSDADRW